MSATSLPKGRASPMPLLPLLAAALGIAIYAAMDALMKALGLAMGSYAALFWRTGAGVAVTGAVWVAGRPRWPERARVRLHVGRGLVVAVMAPLWFHAITLIPLAEAVAISFFAPLLALWLARVLLGERADAAAVAGSVMGLAGVVVIIAGRLGAPHGPRVIEGIAEVIASAALYALNLVLQRHQAQQAPPAEIAFFQTLTVFACLALGARWVTVPGASAWPLIGAGAACATGSLLLLSWAYARAPAAVLLPTEYTAFPWLALFGWWFFGEEVTLATAVGAALIVGGCVVAVRRPAPSPPQEAML